MPLNDRDYMRGNHPIYCTCVDCVRERRRKMTERNRKISYLGSSRLLSSKYAWMVWGIVIGIILMLIFY
jgi:hypothetical protein